ncbi:MAG: low molecular weight protein arginine phosphatase [Candidatus Lokiarchaeota archaeon]|nr:low molecular weight protein arginine phosphatase [Candidatus Lokiarchaeota archaeon]
MDKIKRILFVCLGNTARSPPAEYLARYYAEIDNVDLIFSSAGFINAFSYMQRESQDYLNSKKINHSDFQPQLITRSLLKSQDLILTMEKSHSIDILKIYNNIPNIEKKTYTLKEFNGETQDLDIIDPYYTTSDMYREVLKIIDDNVMKAVGKIQKLNSQL